jgi:hypothetical protein
VVLTVQGRKAFAAVDRLQTPWVNALAKELRVEDIAAAKRTVAALRRRLEEAVPEARASAASRTKR